MSKEQAQKQDGPSDNGTPEPVLEPQGRDAAQSEEAPVSLVSEPTEEAQRILAQRTVGILHRVMEDDSALESRYGTQARRAGQALKTQVVNRLKQNITYRMFWEWFERAPEEASDQLRKALNAIIEEDEEFSDDLREHLDKIDRSRDAFQEAQSEAAAGICPYGVESSGLPRRSGRPRAPGA